MKRFPQIFIRGIFILIFSALSSCIGSKLKNQVGHTKFEMANNIGEPSRIINISNGDQLYVYFYQDYSQNNYPSIVGFMYINKKDIVYKVEKYKTRLSLNSFLQYSGIN